MLAKSSKGFNALEPRLQHYRKHIRVVSFSKLLLLRTFSTTAPLASKSSSKPSPKKITVPSLPVRPPEYWNAAIKAMKTKAWTPKSVRTGVLGHKMGMIHFWDHWGTMAAYTVIRVEGTVIRCGTIKQLDRHHKRDLIDIEIGADVTDPHKIGKTRFGHFWHAGIPPMKRARGFMITPDAALPVGWKIDARHFFPGQLIDVQGVTKGKGFQGGMKRHGFKGLRATHGVSAAHRSIGATGARQDPGRVFPGKKMPGRMGNKTRTQFRCLVYKIDVPRSLIYLKGCCPGNTGSWLRLRDSVKKQYTEEEPQKPLFPTCLPGMIDEAAQELSLPPDSRGDPGEY